MKRKCYLKIKSFDGGVEIGGVEKIQDENGPINPLRLLVENEEDVAAAFTSLKSLIDRFGERAEDFCMDWAFVVLKEMSASGFLKKIDGVDYIPACELTSNQERLRRGLRLEGRFGVFVFPNNWKEEK